ncbi:MAG TPA: cell wall hydrolase [Burkholderiales bacterium]|nr:cell wall hydrolase [Burkholderiales bacterium]
MRGKVAPMLWKLRILWNRLDKAALIFAVFFGAVIAALAFAAGMTFTARDSEQLRVREFHARSIECLALNIYYEARGEPVDGQYAVAEVTMNRKSAPGYPSTVCEVVYQRAAFSWTDYSTVLAPPSGREWERAQRIAKAVYYQKRLPNLRGALFYHATYVRPDWSTERERVKRIGRHIFYR